MSGARIETVDLSDRATRPDATADRDDVRANDPHSSEDLKHKTARGAVISVVGQAANFALRLGSMIILARLVTPEHFGLVGMVTALTGFLALFRDAGLAQATVQRALITNEQTSTLFWINVAVGCLLAGLMAIAAPLIAGFYGDPRLIWITIALGAGFVFSGASAQHRALLQRQMRFGALVAVDVAALAVSILVGTGMAIAGMGYWALVTMALASPAVTMAGMWTATHWVPGRPRRGTGIRSMLHYGGVFTLNGLVIYVAYNVDKVLLGRFWGAEALGIYGRAYQLISLPTENLHTTIGWVMFPALARVQNDPARLRNYFLKGYSFFLAAVMPITVACALFAKEIVLVLLGPQWGKTVPVFQLLAPTILAFALINPFAHLMQATGRVVRSLKISLLIAPVVMLGYVLGLPEGPTGVALGFSVAMLLLVVPAVQWAKHGTLISTGDLMRVVAPPLMATLVGAAAAFAIGATVLHTGPLIRLITLTTILFLGHFFVLLFVLGQKKEYVELLRTLRIGSAVSPRA